jgi:SAM-dependent methyltransferase
MGNGQETFDLTERLNRAMIAAGKGENLFGKIIDYELWDNRFQFTFGRNFKELLPQGNGVCLDLGAGTCDDKKQVEELGYRWVGLDNIRNSVLLTILGDGYLLPFHDKTFDVVLINNTLEHLAHPGKALEEVNRVLKNNGLLCGSVCFLEPFHKSYFNFSHWGLEQILKDSGFHLLKIKPGASVFLMLFYYLIDKEAGTNLAPFITKLIVPPFIFSLKVISMIYGLVKFGRLTRGGFLKKMPLILAAHIMFVARKAD